MAQLIYLHDIKKRQHDGKHTAIKSRPVSFTRAELSLILGLYSRKISTGEWRDYALDHRDNMAVFSIYRHAHDQPLYAIVKQGDVFGLYERGQRIKQSQILGDILDLLRHE